MLFTTLTFLVLLIRFGFVAATAYLTTEMLLFGFPVTSDVKAWYAGAGFLCLGVLAVAHALGRADGRDPARARSGGMMENGAALKRGPGGLEE